MATTRLTPLKGKELIPPNPAALDFEERFRENLQLFLNVMIDFESDFVDLTNLLTGGGTASDSLSAGMQDVFDYSNQAHAELLSTLQASDHPDASTIAATESWTAVDGSVIDSAVRFTSLRERFLYLEENFARKTGDSAVNFNADSITGNTLTISSTVSQLNLGGNRITNLGDPTQVQDAATKNYTDTTFALLAGDNNQDFQTKNLSISGTVSQLDLNHNSIVNLQDPIQAQDAATKNYVDNYPGSILKDFSAKDLTVQNTLSLVGDLDMNNTKIINLQDLGSSSSPNDAVNKKYVDGINTVLSQQISNINGSTVPGFQQNTSLFNVTDGQFLSVSSGVLTWANPPTFDPSTSPYGWLTHPQVAFHEVQFDGELYIDRTLTAGFTYFVAGNLVFPNLMSDGVTACTSQLTLMSGVGQTEGATLIVQGHVIGDITRLVEDTTNANLPRIIVQNWADSRADYVVRGTLKTSELNITQDTVFAGRLILESGSTFEIDTNVKLTFKELVNNGGTVTETTGSIYYFDPQKIIEQAPAALDTFIEIADKIDSTDFNVATVVNDVGDLQTDVGDLQTDVVTLQGRADTNDNQISTLTNRFGPFSYSQDIDGNHIYKFNP